MASSKKHFIPLESDPALFTELIHTLGMSPRLAFHDLLTLSPPDDNDDAGLLASVPRPALALILVIPAPNGYSARLRDEEAAAEVPVHDKSGDDEDAVFYCQTIGNACGLFAILHAVSNGEARGFVEPNTHIARLISQCAPLSRAQRITALEADEQLAAAHASVASRGSTAPPEDITEEVPFAYMTFVMSRKSGRLYQLEGCRRGPVDLGCVLGEDEDMLSKRALDAVNKFVQEAGRGIEVGYSAMALSVTNTKGEK
ncbi:ubiquitin C-terminal hydrolase L3 [Astrocystis sublimbata]|nr:ubiquitin C-terminal hydrolase L3 [Astrocystis sublimbata]